MADKQYTLDQLEQLTGFSKRQIRYYITEKLVPGAGDQRGPYSMYGEETLQRLEMIAVMKEQPTGPTGRTMTLAEIRHALDNMPELRTCGGPVVQESARDYLNSMDKNIACSIEPCAVMPDMQMFSLSQSVGPAEENQLDDLLQSLQSLLDDLGSDTRIDSQASEGESWRRVTSPDVEIQVRTPDNMEARLRLKRMATQMGRLLAREE